MASQTPAPTPTPKDKIEKELSLKNEEETPLNEINNSEEKELNINQEEKYINDYNNKEDNKQDTKEEETKDKDEEKELKEKEEDNQNVEHILSNTREDITFSQMNESNMSRESCQTYQSLPFKDDKPDLDLPYFNPTKYANMYWKVFHSLTFFLFASILATSTWFYYKQIRMYYHISLTISNSFFVFSTMMEWTYFKKGCIGSANLNSKLKNNIDKSFKAKVLRSEYGITYFISFMGSLMLLGGNVYYYIYNGFKYKKTININNIDKNFVDFGLFGMLTLALSQIMKIEKMLTENKTNSVKSDFPKSLVEILLFFGVLFYGASYMIQLFYVNVEESSLDALYLIIRAIGNLILFVSSLVLQYRYYLSNYNDLNIDEDYSEF